MPSRLTEGDYRCLHCGRVAPAREDFWTEHRPLVAAPRCEGCASPLVLPLGDWELDIDDDGHQVGRCPECKSPFITPTPDETLRCEECSHEGFPK